MSLPPLKHYRAIDDVIYRNKYSLAPRWPFRLLICGASGTGKTNILVNLVLQYLTYDKLYVYAKDLRESKYAFLQDLVKDFPEEALFSEANDIVSVDELDSTQQNLIIFDDHLTQKHQGNIIDLFIRGRKKNASIIYLTQSYYGTPKNIRLQCDYIILMKSCNQREINTILKEHAVDIKKKYDQAVKHRFNFFLIDIRKNEFRKNFDRVL